jgi:membrane protein YqaA with SNARE-associated domain
VTALRRHALDIAAFIWGMAEATLFFFVPDVILSYIGLKRGAKAAARASVIAAIGAGVGGAIMAAWSLSDPQTARAAVLAVPAISEAMAARAADAVAENWFIATLFGPLSSTPFKLYAILAPHAGASVAAFALAGLIARLPRFLAVSLGVALIGRVLKGRISPRVQTWAFVGAWALFYAVFFARMPN